MDLQQQEYAMQFLMGLNESYAQIRAQILMMTHLPSLLKVFSLVIQGEQKHSISSSLNSDPLNLNDPNASASTFSLI